MSAKYANRAYDRMEYGGALTSAVAECARKRVIASADCGFSWHAIYRTEVHATIVWEKFKDYAVGPNRHRATVGTINPC
jgi:hypothetical protein